MSKTQIKSQPFHSADAKDLSIHSWAWVHLTRSSVQDLCSGEDYKNTRPRLKARRHFCTIIGILEKQHGNETLSRGCYCLRILVARRSKRRTSTAATSTTKTSYSKSWVYRRRAATWLQAFLNFKVGSFITLSCDVAFIPLLVQYLL